MKMAARIGDQPQHPMPCALCGTPGSLNVIIGGKPAWRGVPAAAAKIPRGRARKSQTPPSSRRDSHEGGRGHRPERQPRTPPSRRAKGAAAAAMGSSDLGAPGAGRHSCLCDSDGAAAARSRRGHRRLEKRDDQWAPGHASLVDTILEAVGPPNKISSRLSDGDDRRMTASCEEARMTAAELCSDLLMTEESRALLQEEMTPLDFVDVLAGGQQYQDAVTVLSRALPVRERVWWACYTARQCPGFSSDPRFEAAVQAAEAWVSDGSEASRYRAFEAAQLAPLGSRAQLRRDGGVRQLGSMAPADAEPIPPPPHLCAQLAAGAVIVASVARGCGGGPGEIRVFHRAGKTALPVRRAKRSMIPKVHEEIRACSSISW